MVVSVKAQTVLGALAVFAVGLFTYYSASRIGLLNNDWYYLDQVARLSLPQYLVQYFDPRLQTGWYRPIFGLLYLVVYTFFGADSTAHHLAHIVLHAATATLLFALVARVSKNVRVALIAALVYVGLPVYSKAVYWPSVPDPLSMFLYLLAIWFWLDYLDTALKRFALATFILFLLSVMTKEASVTLPVVLLLIDRLIVCRKVTFANLVRRYAPYAVALPMYLGIEYSIQHSGSYVSMASYGFGSHVFSNLIDGLALVAFPWDLGAPSKYVWLGVAAIIFVGVVLVKRSKALAFLGIFAMLNLVPMLGFPTEWFETRYLYTPTMVSSILIGYLLEAGAQFLNRQWWYAVLASAGIVLILFANYTDVTEAVASWGEIARQRRVPFREFVQEHPAFPEDTYLYFIDTANVPFYDFSVMLFLRYGRGVTIKSALENQVASLKEHRVSYVYYFDPIGKPVEIVVDKDAQTRSSPPLPAEFSIPVRLEGYDVAQTQIKPGEPLVLLLYWEATEKIDRDYTIFTHLVDEKGEIIAGYDGQPRNGNLPTSSWTTNHLIVDPIVMPILWDVPAKSGYCIEVGLYYLPTMERVQLVNGQGQPIADSLIIESFSVVN
jgi:hypothetical protein